MARYVTQFTAAKGAYGFPLEVLALAQDNTAEDWADATSVTYIVEDPNGTITVWTASLINSGNGGGVTPPLPQFSAVVPSGALDVVGDYSGDVRVVGSGYDIILEDQFTITVRAINEG